MLKDEEIIQKDRPDEIWKWVPGYENEYEVSNLGNVKTRKFGRNKLLKPQESMKYGYLRVALSKNNKHFHTGIHRIVALAFIPHDPINNTVNHKNKITSDNRVENLEWCTIRQNVNHARTLANKVCLSSVRARFADIVIPQIQKMVPLE